MRQTHTRRGRRDVACFLAFSHCQSQFICLFACVFFPVLLSRFDLISWVLLSQGPFSLSLFLCLFPQPPLCCKCSHFNQMPANLLDSLRFPLELCLLRVTEEKSLSALSIRRQELRLGQETKKVINDKNKKCPRLQVSITDQWLEVTLCELKPKSVEHITCLIII